MTDIVKQLRALVILDEVGSNNPLGREAADEIERLERLLKMKVTPGYELLATTIEEKDAEIERLRATLVRIDGINDNPAHYNPEIDAVVQAALRREAAP